MRRNRLSVQLSNVVLLGELAEIGISPLADGDKKESMRAIKKLISCTLKTCVVDMATSAELDTYTVIQYHDAFVTGGG